MAHSGTLTPRKRRLVAAMMTSRSVAEAAETASISLRSAWRYLSEPAVKAALSAALDDALAAVTRRTVDAMGRALDTLEDVQKDGDASPSSKVAAARVVMVTGPRLRESTELSERVQALEEKIGRTTWRKR